jgi:trk system potassium uptake protein TrkH
MPTADHAGLSRSTVIDHEKIGLPVGVMVAVLGLTMLVPAVVDLQAGNPNWRIFVQSALVVTGLGATLALACLRPLQPLTLRECFVLVVASWLVMSLAGALPLMLTADGLAFTDAFFEAASALTTTGSTVMTGLDGLPPGLLLWRSIMQWIGGLGIIAFGLLLLPFLGIGGLQLFRIESSDTYEKTVARVRVFARRLIAVYVILTVACALVYRATGMSGFDAVNHAMTTVSTGGFSTHDASFGYFNNTSTLWFAAIFMLAGALPFSLYVRLFDAYRTNLLDDIQVRTLLTMVGVISLMLVLWLTIRQHTGLGTALTHAVFNVVSIITTTGYASSDYLQWGTFPFAMFFAVTLLGGCTGSTSGGIKTFRLIVGWKIIARLINKLRFPDGVFPIRCGERIIDNAVQHSLLAFFTLFLTTLLGVAFALSLTGLDVTTSLSGAATALSNVGPGLGDIIGPSGNFSSLPAPSKWILALAMIVGRLEIGAAYVVFLPAFWRI